MKKISRRDFLKVTGASAAALSLAACGGSSSSSTAASSAAPASSAAASTAAAEVKDTVILATSGEPYRFFGISSKGCSGDDNLVLSNVYDCLLRLEADGTLSPALAESYTVSDDGLVYTFNLRKDVKFHDGSDFTAEDVKFTFDYGFSGPIGTALFVNFSSCEIVDDYTVNITLSSPYAAFPYGVASRLGGIASKKYFDEVGEDGYMAAPIGTGPYKFTEYVSGDHTTLTAFDDYFRGKPAIQTIVIQTVADTNTQILGLQNGDYDVVRNPSIETCTTRIEGQEGVAWNSTLSTGRVALYMNDWTGACKDKNFRKAVQAAINKDDINDAVYAGYSVTLDIDMCPNYGGYVTTADGVETVAYDPEAAQKYLAEASYNNEEFPLTVQSGTALESAATIIQAELMSIGINCTVNAVDNQSYSGAWTDRSYEAYIINNLCSLVDADGMYTEHRLDRAAWEDRVFARDDEISDLLLQGRAATGDERKKLYVEAANIVTEEAYDVPLVNDLTVVAYRSALQGVEAHCLGSYYFFNWSYGA